MVMYLEKQRQCNEAYNKKTVLISGLLLLSRIFLSHKQLLYSLGSS